MKTFAIVPAAGSGRRYGNVSKAFLLLGGRPVISWVLDTLEEVEEISEVIPVFRDADMERALKLIEERGYKKIKKVAPGGRERQDSVYHALNLITEAEAVVIHDAARPGASQELFRNTLRELKEYDGVITAIPLIDTVKEVEKDLVVRTLDRTRLRLVQTPQAFKFKVLKEAYKRAMKESIYFTDDASLLEHYNGKIKVVMGSHSNIKITVPEDLKILEVLLEGRNKN